MSEKRMAIRCGFTAHMQNLDDAGNIVSENFVNNWGGDYSRLDPDEAVLFENALKDGCKKEFLALIDKGLDVAGDFGLEAVGQVKKTPPNK